MLLSVGEYDEAVNCFVRILDANPRQGQAYFGMAAVLMQKHDAEGCTQFLEHAIELDVKIAAAYTCMAMIYCSQKNFRQAFEVIDRAKTILGNSWHLRLQTAKIALLACWEKLFQCIFGRISRGS
jgi:tetratricopeptide (TPR) repeat protein